MCHEHPESRYHDTLLFVLSSAKDICNRNYLLLRYPQFLGSFLVSSPQVLIELGFSKIFNKRNSMIFFRFVSMIFLRMCHMLLGVNSVKLLCMCSEPNIMSMAIFELIIQWLVCDLHIINRFKFI